jgi:translocation and assembly module TamB
VALDSLVLMAADGSHVSIDGAWQRGDSARADVVLQGFELAAIQKFIHPQAAVTGTLDGTISVRVDPSGAVLGHADLEPGPGTITLADRTVEYRGRMSADADLSGLKAAIGLTMESRGTQVALVDAKVAIPHLVVGRDSLGGQPIDGNLDIDSADIGPLVELIYPGLDGVGGVLSIHVTPRGTAGDFRLVGRLALEEARADFVSGLRLREVSASLDADGSGQVSFDGSATSGGGHVKLEARSVRSQNGWINGTFNVSGERFQVINQPEAQVFISPNLDLLLEESNATLTGDVTVPYAKLEIAEVPPSAVSQSSDVVFLEDSLATRQRFNARATVRVALGDSVSFSGFGLRARLAGSLTLEDERGRPTRGSGEIRLVDGIYRAYGSELKIDPGRLVFGGGPIDNPGLDIRAYRNVSSQNVMEGAGDIVGMNIGGTLLKPEISLFSRPPMSESETLSYLMFGRPLSSGSEEDQTALASAALLLGMQRGSKLTGDIGKQFALDEAYIESGSAYNEASFVAGKYLSPKLFVSYATGFFEHTNSFRVRYSLTNNWTVQAESGRASSTDLLYRFEQGK